MDIISLIEKNLDKKADINFLPMQLGDVPVTYADIDKSIKQLDYNPTTSFNDGIKKFINWYKSYYV